MPTWPEHVMWWHVYPLGFVGAPIRDGVDPDAAPVHRLPQLEPWLEHVIDLGLNGLLLGPVFASETHGYDTVDHHRIDPRLGDEHDLRRLVDAAHGRGIRVLLDGVFNHVGRGHPAFRALTEDGPDLFRGRWVDGRFEPDVFEGHDALVALDHSSPAVADLVVDVMCHWLERGIDGWRLDAAYAVPSDFWARILPRVRERFPDAWFLGEVIHGEASAIVRESTIDALTQYELWQGIWHGIADRNFFELSHAIERNDELLATFVPQTFVGNHDVTRIASAVGVEFAPHAIAVLFTVAGIPSIYAGDEYAFLGEKEERLGGDDAVRPEFAEQPPAPDTLDDDAERMLRLHQQLIALRRQHPWLHRAHTDVIHIANTAIVLRTATGSGAIVTALNLADDAVTVPVADAREVLAGDARLDGAHAELPPRAFAVLSS